MPELPEVETVVKGLKSAVSGLKIVGIWADYAPYFELPKDKIRFKRLILGRKILKIERKGKGILFYLDSNFCLFVQQRMTGIFILSFWKHPKERFLEKIKKENKFAHLVLFLEKNKALVFVDQRKFGKFFLGEKEKIFSLAFLRNLGKEPLSSDFKFKTFFNLAKKHGKKILKNFLMDQKIIAGIGNIYANEILWQAGLSPFKLARTLKEKEAKNLYKAIVFILKEGIKHKGSSISDFRDIRGRTGFYQKKFLVFMRKGKKCFRCGNLIKKVKISGRGSYFCPKCQS
jgi:formamidopyrimidine-DNA glycosylase